MNYIRITNLELKLRLEEPGNVKDEAEEDDGDDVPHESDVRVPVPSDVSVVVGEADSQVSGNIFRHVIFTIDYQLYTFLGFGAQPLHNQTYV